MAGPLELNLISKEIIGSNHQPNKIKNRSEKTISKPRFKNLFSDLSSGKDLILITGSSRGIKR